MKTNLLGNSNGVLVDNEGNVMSVIKCLAGENINIKAKIERAIKEHYSAESASIIDCVDALTSYNTIRFKSQLIEDGIEQSRDFSIEIVATY